MSKFHIAADQDILDGKVTDAYFARTQEILGKKDISKPVVMELRASSLPSGWPWAVLAGLDEALTLIENIGKPIDFYCLDEGTIFCPGDPIGYLIGDYKDICVYETAFLGLFCQATGIATRSARCVKAAEHRPVLSFGARRLHPAMSILVDRNAYLGGCKGFSSVITAEEIGIPASGTIPHALVLLVGDTAEATKLFDEVIDPNVPRISLIDTFSDEKYEALRVAEALGDRLFGIRLDTPSSRRGDFIALLKEVRWELNLRGYDNVKIVASGGLNEDKILQLNPYCDSYGVGTAISNAPVVDFALDIVEIDDVPIAKRGKFAGRKRLLDQGRTAFEREMIPWKENDPRKENDLIQLKIQQGKLVYDLPDLNTIRDYVLEQIPHIGLEG
ncbi:nicotinate phosphoribosyltransferase [bacterium]|nr:nicotinate phosphoribosyltransferase [bacterium]